MSNKKERAEVAKEAMDKLPGGSAELAEVLSKLLQEDIQTTKWRVQKWRQNGVPPHMVIQVEHITGVSRHKLYPDLYPLENLYPPKKNQDPPSESEAAA